MTAERQHRLEAIFHDVIEMPEDARAEALRSRCGGDDDLREEIGSLIRASEAEVSASRERAAQPRVPTHPAAAPRRIGPYAIDRLLGRGGMGSVYLAHRADGAFEQQVALKLVDLPLTSALFRERFRAERQILADLVHPGIARLLDGGMSDGGELYIAMEYVDGITITEYCRRHRLGIAERVALFREVCAAVQFAHQHLVVHRDLKPDNILIAADGSPRLLDFGTAKLLQPSAAPAAAGFTQHGIQPFTPNFASPEQILGESVTTASDVYSLGVLLYLLLTEVPPYTIQAFTTAEFLRVICHYEPPAPSVAAREAGTGTLDADLDAITQKALRKEAARRYPSVEQFSADLEAYLAGRPVGARRGTYRYRAAKFVRRNRLAVGMTALLAVSLLVAGSAIVLQSQRVKRMRQRAEARSQDLRQLSGSLLSEIDEAIKELPGSTPVQRLLVAQVLQHLDRLSTDADGDAVTQRDLVEAYTRLGNLQGNPYEQNLGDPAGAQASLEKAIRMGNALKRTQSTDAELLGGLALAEQSLGEVLFGIGRTPEAIHYMRAAITDFDRRNRLPGTGAAELAAEASAVGALGDLQGQNGVASLGDPVAARAAYDRAAALSEQALHLQPGFVRAQRGIAIDHLKIGNLRLATDPAAALQEYQLSLAAWQALPRAEQASASTRRGIAQTHLEMAAAAADVDDYERAIQELELAAPTLEYLARADADDSRVTYDLASFHLTVSTTYTERITYGMPDTPPSVQQSAERAIAELQEALPILERLARLEPDNQGWLAKLAFAQTRLGTLQQQYRPGTGGEALARTGAAALLRTAAASSATADVLEFATQALLEVEPVSLRDPDRTVSLAERLAQATVHHNPADLLLLARAQRAAGNPEAARAAAREGLAQLPTPPKGGPTPRLNRLLRQQIPST